MIADLLKTFSAAAGKELLVISYLCTRKRFPRCTAQQGMKMGIRCKSGTIPVAVSSAIRGRHHLWPLLLSATEWEGVPPGTSQKTCRDTRNKNLEVLGWKNFQRGTLCIYCGTHKVGHTHPRYLHRILKRQKNPLAGTVFG